MPSAPLTSLLGELRRATDDRQFGDLTDSELLQRYRRGRDEAAFAALVRRHGPTVLAACRRLLDPADADDAFQASFLVLVREAHAIREGAALGGWLFRVATRIALRLRKAADRRRALT